MLYEVNGKTPQIHPESFVHEAAILLGDVKIGAESSVWPGAVIRADNGKITIGERTNIQDNSVIHSDGNSKIGHNVTIGHAVICHASKISDNCLLGNGSILNEGVEIGDFCLVAAGSTILENMKIPSNSLITGTPARIRGKLTERHVELIKLSFNIYVEKIEQYKKS